MSLYFNVINVHYGTIIVIILLLVLFVVKIEKNLKVQF